MALMMAMRRSASTDRLDTAHRGHHHQPRPRARLQLSLRRWQNFSVPVPAELWGATSLALKFSVRRAGVAQAAWSIANAFTAAPAAPDGSPSDEPLSQSSSPPKTLTEALDYRPTLTAWEDSACLLLSVAVCSLVYALARPPAPSLLFSAGMAALCALVLTLARSWLLERYFWAVQCAEQQLAYPDSKFLCVDGAALHFQRRLGTAATPTAALHFMHGFGASSFSWSFVLDKLAVSCSALSTAHDMPGFGLSARPSKRAFYTMGFNARAAEAVMDAELALLESRKEKSIATTAAAAAAADAATDAKEATGGRDPYAGTSAAAPLRTKRVLIGHSMGGAAVAEAVIRQPEAFAGIVLVAPAIVAMWTSAQSSSRTKAPSKPQRDADAVATPGTAVMEEVVATQAPPGSVELVETMIAAAAVGEDGSSGTKTPQQRRKPAWRVAAALAQLMLAECARLVLALVSPLLVLVLRRLVRTRAFWERGLSSAWSDPGKITPSYVEGYRIGQLVRGWEHGILRFLDARFTETAGLWRSMLDTFARHDGHLSQAERLAAACTAAGVTVLIVHGVDDALVPVVNSRRLARLLPGARLVEVKACGHMPHEECPQQFVDEVTAFVQGLQAKINESVSKGE